MFRMKIEHQSPYHFTTHYFHGYKDHSLRLVKKQSTKQLELTFIFFLSLFIFTTN